MRNPLFYGCPRGWPFLILEPQRSRRKETCVAHLLLRSLQSVHGFGPLGILHQPQRGQYATGTAQVGSELTGYAILRRWPSTAPYLRLIDVQQLVAPLLLNPSRFLDDLAILEQRGIIKRITSSGLDQVWPVEHRRPEEALWINR